MSAPTSAPITLFFAPKTRAATALWFLEELGLPYERDAFLLDSGRHKQPEYLAMNPMGKVPLVVHDGEPLWETAAIAMYLSDRYPETGLAPAFDAPERAAYLRWCVFPGAVIEPGISEVFFKWDVPSSSVAWGSAAQMVEVATAAVQAHTWIAGERFTAADVLMGSMLQFAIMFGALENEGPIADYVARATARPAYQRAIAIEAETAAALAAK